MQHVMSGIAVSLIVVGIVLCWSWLLVWADKHARNTTSN